MLISRNLSQQDASTFKLKIGNVTLTQSSSIKYLGLHIDNNMKWSTHISSITAKLNKTAGIFSKLRYLINLLVFKMIYSALVYPYLQYCLLSWWQTNKSILQPLITVQNKIVKFMTFANYRDHATPSYIQLRLMKIEDIYNLELFKFMFKFHNRQLPEVYTNYFTLIKDVHSHYTRSSSLGHYFQTRFNTNFGLNSLQHNGVILWNSVPKTISASPSLNIASKQYKIFLINKYSMV